MRTVLLLAFVFHLTRNIACGGDAVAIAYNSDGVWTTVTYYASSTPKGGSDYKGEAAAREAAVRDLQQREGAEMARASVIDSSDRTGHVAYARGKSAAGADLHAVGYGASKEAAEKNALDQLQRDGATKKLTVIYRYFSYGSDAPPAAGGRATDQAGAGKR